MEKQSAAFLFTPEKRQFNMKVLQSSLDLIRRTASELITGIEGQLKEIQRDWELMQAQEKESILLKHHEKNFKRSISLGIIFFIKYKQISNIA